ncbi:MAG: Transmembrane component NikQ of energizing module of nickel ECF transporter [Anaerolineae bacterium]|nr:MAG: Transmembrane component NikQ of energizing module of nickel ECF transporter [Anaerolineae bacterium]
MHVHFLDPYQHRQSLIHAMDGRVKLVLAVAFILTTSLTPNGAWAAYILLFALLISAELLSELPIGYFLRRAFLALPFVLAALPLPFTVPGDILAEFSVGRVALHISTEGLIRLLSIAIKSWLSVQVAVLLTVSTPFPDLLQAMRALKLPRLLVAVFGLMWRYLFVLVDEALRLMRARSARSSQHPVGNYRTGRTISWRAQVTGSMAGSLFLRAFERSDRIYLAMLARGYDGEVRLRPLPPLTRLQWLSLLSGIALLLLILALGQFLLLLR